MASLNERFGPNVRDAIWGAAITGPLMGAWIVAHPYVSRAAVYFINRSPEERDAIIFLVGAWAILAVFLATIWCGSRALKPPLGYGALTLLRRPLRNTAALHQVARHEAAHAIVGLAYGGTLVDVDIIVCGDQDGQAFLDWPDDMSAWDAAWAELTCSVAGTVVDLESGQHHFGSCDDIRAAMDYAAMIISTGVHPAGYAGSLTFDGLLAGARQAAGDAAMANRAAFDQLTARLVKTKGRRKLRRRAVADLDIIPATRT